MGSDEKSKLSRVVDLDIDIGADAVDYKCVPHSRTIYRESNICSQCNCEPGVSLWARDGNAETRRVGQGGRGRDELPEEARGKVYQHQLYAQTCLPVSIDF